MVPRHAAQAAQREGRSESRQVREQTVGHLAKVPRFARRWVPFARRACAAAAEPGGTRRPSRSCVISKENATISAASHAICVLAIRSNVSSWATGALLLRSRLAGAAASGLGATEGFGAAIGGSATCGFLGSNEEFGTGGTNPPLFVPDPPVPAPPGGDPPGVDPGSPLLDPSLSLPALPSAGPLPFPGDNVGDGDFVGFFVGAGLGAS